MYSIWTLVIAKQHEFLSIQGKRSSANIANIDRIDNVGHIIVYMNKQQRCKECNMKPNFICKNVMLICIQYVLYLCLSLNYVIRDALQLNIELHDVPTTFEGLYKGHAITGKLFLKILIFGTRFTHLYHSDLAIFIQIG